MLLNLLTNAVQHAPQADRVDIQVTLTDGKARIEIRDYGPGIPPERLARLLTRRTSRRAAASGYQGLGLGLVISRELMRAQRGSIDITSDPDSGTTAILELPLWRPNPRPRRKRR